MRDSSNLREFHKSQNTFAVSSAVPTLLLVSTIQIEIFWNRHLLIVIAIKGNNHDLLPLYADLTPAAVPNYVTKPGGTQKSWAFYFWDRKFKNNSISYNWNRKGRSQEKVNDVREFLFSTANDNCQWVKHYIKSSLNIYYKILLVSDFIFENGKNITCTPPKLTSKRCSA